MMKRVLHQPGFVLHSRAYRETSALVEVWTPDHGRLTVMARGVRKEKSALAGILQPFTPLLISFVGRAELMTLTEAELHQPSHALKGNSLFAGFYLNELLMVLLTRFDPHPNLYFAYAKALSELGAPVLQESVLREFEQTLLTELGYGLFPSSETSLHQQFSSEAAYHYFHESGFVSTTKQTSTRFPANYFTGSELLAIAKCEWQAAGILRVAKRLMRLALMPLLGTRLLRSRELFLSPEEAAHG